MGPELLLLAVHQAKNIHAAETYLGKLREKYNSTPKPASIIWDNTMAKIYPHPEISPEFAKPLQNFLEQVEKGDIKLRGYDMCLQATAYYKLAASQVMQGNLEKGLETYRKLAAISPHYAALDMNFANIYLKQANKPETPVAEKKQLLQLARQRLEQQIQHNWHGTAAKEAKDWLAQLPKE